MQFGEIIAYELSRMNLVDKNLVEIIKCFKDEKKHNKKIKLGSKEIEIIYKKKKKQ